MSPAEISSEVRGWTLLLFAVVGGVITLLAYRQNQKQRRLENSFRFLGLFKEMISDADRTAWIELFHSTSDPAGAPIGFFVSMEDEAEQEISLDLLFAEGPPDQGAIQRMTEFFEMIALEDKDHTINLRVAYYHLGHYMDKIREWILSFPDGNGAKFLQENFPGFTNLYASHRIKKHWRCRLHAITG